VVHAPILDDLPEVPVELVELLAAEGLPVTWPTTGNEAMAYIDAIRDAGINVKRLAGTIGLTGGALRSGVDHYKDRTLTDKWRRRLATAGVRVVAGASAH